MADVDALAQMHKICGMCERNLPWWEFMLSKPRKPVLRLPTRCRECRSAASKVYREQNRERLLVLQREWNARNAERLKPYRAARYEQNQELRRAQERMRCALDAAANPEKYRAKFHERRARILSNGGNYTPEEWEALCTECGNICLMCRKPKKLTVDHVVPISRGGRNDIGNIQPLCRSCNARKSDKIIDLRGSHQTPPTDSLQDPSNP